MSCSIAGVFGTTEILFKSQMRGLKLSEALGSGFSCNGNTVAYLVGSRGPLNAHGLDRKKLSQTPIQARPGPSISSSYSSSLGFTIQVQDFSMQRNYSTLTLYFWLESNAAWF